MKKKEIKTDFKKKTKEVIFKEIFKKYKEDPEFIKCFFPKIFEIFEKQTKKEVPQWEPFLPLSKLTSEEEKIHKEKLQKLLDKYKKENTLTKEEGLEILEHLIDLGIKNTDNYKEAIEIPGKVLQIDFNKEINKKFNFRKGEVARTVPLILGVNLHLTWDGKILEIELKKKEIELRKKAMNFVGIGEDKEKDVSIRHDFYFKESIK